MLSGVFSFIGKHKILVLILVVGGVGVVWSLGRANQKQESIQTYTVEERDLEKVVVASGEVAAQDQVTLKFPTLGKIGWVGVKKGDIVNQWQAIASLDQTELEKDLKKTLLASQTARANFDETTKETYKDKALTDSIQRMLDKAQYSLDSAVIDVEIADLARRYATIFTPIPGIVIKATDEYAGVNASATTEYVIADPSTLIFKAQVEELDIAGIHVGDTATVGLDALDSETLTSTVSSIDFTPSLTTSGSKAYGVNIVLPADARLRLEMSGDATFVVDRRFEVVAIPVEALQEDEKDIFVTLVNADGTEEKRSITTGLETDDYIEVTEGLSIGDSIKIPE